VTEKGKGEEGANLNTWRGAINPGVVQQAEKGSADAGAQLLERGRRKVRDSDHLVKCGIYILLFLKRTGGGWQEEGLSREEERLFKIGGEMA